MSKMSQFVNQAGAGAPFNKLAFLNRWNMAWLLLSAVSAVLYSYVASATAATPWQLTIQDLLLPFVLFGAGYAVLLLIIHDKVQTDEPIQRLYPLVFWGRKTFLKIGPALRQYLFANDQEETPYNRITRNWIYQTARGKRNTIGFGSQDDMDRVGAMIVLPATFTNKSVKKGEDFGRAYKKIIGQHTGVEPVTLNHFVNISAMSYGALSHRAHVALNIGAKKAGIFQNTGEGGLAPCHEQGGNLIFQMGTAKFGVRDDQGDLADALLRKVAAHPQVKMIEIKLAQGAKPGKGGMLLKEKITEDIATIRKIPMGQDCYSPPRHKEFADVHGLFDFIDHVRAIAEMPVGIKMVIGHTEEIETIAKKMSEEPGRGPDYISVDGGDGGTGAAPLVLSAHAGLPMKPAIAVADWALRRYGVRNKVILFASGKIATPIDVAVAMALGADATYIARGFMLSLGCVQALECHSNTCPTGIATMNKQAQKALDIEASSERVSMYAQMLYKETQMLAETCGYNSPDQITAHDIMVVTSPGHLDYLSELHGVSAYEASLERDEAKRIGISVGEMKIRERHTH